MAVSSIERIERGNPRNIPTHERYAASQEERTTSGKYMQNLRDGTRNVQAEFESADRAAINATKRTRGGRMVRNSAAYTARKRKRKTSLGAQAWDKGKVSVANTWINFWVMFWYLAFQLPFATVSTVGLGMGYAAFQLAESFGETLVGGTLYYVFGNETVVSAGSRIITAALELFNIYFNPILLFIGPFALVFLFSLLQLLLCWGTYSLFGIKSLSGQSSGAKQITFLIALFGIFLPILNLFPLISLWTVVVWWKPR